LYGVFDAILVNGCIAFGAKYFQQQFGLTASTAGIIFGQFFFHSSISVVFISEMLSRSSRPKWR